MNDDDDDVFDSGLAMATGFTFVLWAVPCVMLLALFYFATVCP